MVFTELLSRLKYRPSQSPAGAESPETSSEKPLDADTEPKVEDPSPKIQVEPSIAEAVKNFNEEDWR